MDFISRCDDDPELREALERLQNTPTVLADVVTVGRRFGYEFTIDELRMAHEKDWQLRRAHYGRATDTAD